MEYSAYRLMIIKPIPEGGTRLETALDEVDWRLLEELQRDGRLSFNELSRRVALSAPAVAERVRRLESRGVITGYHAEVDPAAVGLRVTALVRLQCYGPTCLLRDEQALHRPEILRLFRVTGDACCVLFVAVPTMVHFERLIDDLAEHGRPSSTMVLSTPVPRRGVRRPE